MGECGRVGECVWGSMWDVGGERECVGEWVCGHVGESGSVWGSVGECGRVCGRVCGEVWESVWESVGEGVCVWESVWEVLGTRLRSDMSVFISVH